MGRIEGMGSLGYSRGHGMDKILELGQWRMLRYEIDVDLSVVDSP